MPTEPQRDIKKKKIGAFAAILLSLAFMFGIGWLVGNDRVSLTDPVTNQELRSATIDGLDELYDELVRNFDGEVDPEAFVEGLKRGGVASVGDSFTEYLSPDETKEFNDSLDGTFEGIGAELGKEGSFVVIVAPLKGSPAEAAGVQAGDIIIEIDGEDATDITISEAVKTIRGEKGTDVTLTLIRDGEQVEATITRDTIDIPSVEWRVEDGIGIIEMSRFGTDTTQLARQAALEFNEKNITKIILDVRGNPGGLLDQAVQVSDLWLPKGAVVVEEKRGEEVIRSFTSTNDPLLVGVETVVLINEGSASASEIVAGALKDNGLATLLGQTSFGKGSVQQLINLSSGGSLKVTIARWFTPNGENIDKEGIAPDVEVELSAEDREEDRDPQLDEAKRLLNE